jgi:hypothetical protein
MSFLPCLSPKVMPCGYAIVHRAGNWNCRICFVPRFSMLSYCICRLRSRICHRVIRSTSVRRLLRWIFDRMISHCFALQIVDTCYRCTHEPNHVIFVFQLIVMQSILCQRFETSFRQTMAIVSISALWIRIAWASTVRLFVKPRGQLSLNEFNADMPVVKGCASF